MLSFSIILSTFNQNPYIVFVTNPVNRQINATSMGIMVSARTITVCVYWISVSPVDLWFFSMNTFNTHYRYCH